MALVCPLKLYCCCTCKPDSYVINWCLLLSLTVEVGTTLVVQMGMYANHTLTISIVQLITSPVGWPKCVLHAWWVTLCNISLGLPFFRKM